MYQIKDFHMLLTKINLYYSENIEFFSAVEYNSVI